MTIPPDMGAVVYDLGYPKAFFSAKGLPMKEAIAKGELHSRSMLAVTPNSKDGTCVTINTTRVVLKDCVDHPYVDFPPGKRS